MEIKDFETFKNTFYCTGCNNLDKCKECYGHYLEDMNQDDTWISNFFIQKFRQIKKLVYG